MMKSQDLLRRLQEDSHPLQLVPATPARGNYFEYGSALRALAGIEADSTIVLSKAAAGRLNDDNVLREFLPLWHAEEQAHATILSEMASHVGNDSPSPSQSTVRRGDDLALRIISRLAPRVLISSYCALGTVVEFSAVMTYRALGRAIPDWGSVFSEIARQESGHMRLYYERAQETLTACSGLERQIAWRLVDLLWYPPGYLVVGPQEYAQTFLPILRDKRFQRDIAGADAYIRRLPGFGKFSKCSAWIGSATGALGLPIARTLHAESST